MPTRVKRSAGVIAVAAMAMLVLSACLSVSYKLTVNSDATVSGTLQAKILKEAASALGLTSAAQLKESITSGDLGVGVDSDFSRSCMVGEDDTNFTVNCTVDRVQVSDLDEAWSLTKTGNELTLHVVTEASGDSGEDSLMPDINLGSFSLTAEFPGPISSITGSGATKIGSNTVEAKGSLNESIDFTVVAAAESSASSSPAWVFVVLGIAVVVVIGIIAVVLRPGRKKDAAVDPGAEPQPTADSSDPSI